MLHMLCAWRHRAFTSLRVSVALERQSRRAVNPTIHLDMNTYVVHASIDHMISFSIVSRITKWSPWRQCRHVHVESISLWLGHACRLPYLAGPQWHGVVLLLEPNLAPIAQDNQALENLTRQKQFGGKCTIVYTVTSLDLSVKCLVMCGKLSFGREMHMHGFAPNT